MEGLPIPIGDVHDRDHGVDHVVHRDDVGAARVRQQHRRELRQGGQLRQEPEEVVRTIDLVHLAGAGVPDDDGRPVDAVAQPRRGAHQHLGFELGLVVRRRQVLGDVEVLLGVHAGERARHGDRRHVVKGGVQAQREVDHRCRAVDVGCALSLVIGGDVVDRAAVHDVVDGAELGDVLPRGGRGSASRDPRPGVWLAHPTVRRGVRTGTAIPVAPGSRPRSCRRERGSRTRRGAQ